MCQCVHPALPGSLVLLRVSPMRLEGREGAAPLFSCPAWFPMNSLRVGLEAKAILSATTLCFSEFKCSCE